MSCKLTLFGPPTLLDRRGRPVPVPAKTFVLAAFLLSGGAPASRTSIRQFLWPSADPKTAAANLRKFLLRVRERQERFGFELINCERGHVELVPSARIDLDRFLKTSATGKPDDLLALCEIYRGDLLEGMGWQEESNEWIEVQRTKLRDTFISAVAGQLESGSEDVGPVLQRAAARRLIEVDPYNETGHRTLMRLFAEEGEPARVHEVYRGLQQRLREDLVVEPDAATTELYRSLVPAEGRNGIVRAPRSAAQLATEPMAPGLPSTVDDEDDVDWATTFANRSGTPRITILPPLANGGQDLRHQLAGSLIEDVTIGLCRCKSLCVVAPHTAWQLSASGKKNLLKTFGIDYSVESQLQYSGGEYWLSMRLVSAAGRDILWTEQYPFHREHTDQSYRDLSARIIVSLVDKVERAELARYEVAQNQTAYHLYLVGQKYVRVLDLPNVRRARRAFKAAVGVCLDFVPAISGLARTYQLEWLLMARGDNDLLTEAGRLAERALEIDPDDARGHRDSAICNLYAGRFDESLRSFGEAERRNPQHADLLVDYADALQHACDAATALQKINRAIELNPLGPDRYWWTAGDVNFHLERYDDAIACMSRMRDKSPAFRLIAASWAMLGDRKKAMEYVLRAKDIHPDFNVKAWLSILPIRDPDFARRYEQGLREAGFD